MSYKKGGCIRRLYRLPRAEFTKLSQKAYRAQRRDQSEVCGVMIVDSEGTIRLRFLKNQSTQPGRYRLDMNHVKLMKGQIKESNLSVLGTFHSHPISEAIPGLGDLMTSFLNGCEMIYDVCGDKVRLWLKKNRRRAVELQLVIR